MSVSSPSCVSSVRSTDALTQATFDPDPPLPPQFGFFDDLESQDHEDVDDSTRENNVLSLEEILKRYTTLDLLSRSEARIIWPDVMIHGVYDQWRDPVRSTSFLHLLYSS